MENDKMFDLLEKIYVEVQETKSEVKSHTKRLDGLESQYDRLESEVKKIGAKIDGEIIPRQEALLDGYKQNIELLTVLKDDVDKIKQDTEFLKDSVKDINMSIGEMKEDINFVALKTIRNDSKINKISEQLKAVK